MPLPEAAVTVASLARLLHPLIRELTDAAKKAGARGLQRWDQRTFPQKLAKRIKLIDQVRTIWKPEGPISLQEFFHPPKVSIDNRPTRIARLDHLPTNATIIEGIVGQGKSVFLRSLAIEELTQNDGKWLPMFLELKDLSPRINLFSALSRQLESYDIDSDDDTLDCLFRSGKFAILLDGFDELEESIVKETYTEIERLTHRYPTLKIVVTCRPGHEIQKSTIFQTLPISPLSQTEYPAFLDRLKVDAKKSLALRQAIKSSPSKISDLITTPLMLTLVVLVYETESEIPETLPEFFDSLFQVVFTKHDRQKANFNRKHRSGLSERRLQRLFEAFSFMTLQSGYSRTLTGTQFASMFELAAESEGSGCEVDDFRFDITKAACLMLEDGIDSVTYLHKSILEYYAAAFVKRLSDENAEAFYGMAIDRSRSWQEVLVFLEAIDPVRYSRYYLLTVIDEHRKKIVEPCRKGNDRECIKLMGILFHDMFAFYGRDKETQPYEIRGASSTPIQGEEVGHLSHILMQAVVRELSTLNNPLEDFGPIDLSHPKNNSFSVSGVPIFNRLGAKEIRTAIEIFDDRLSQAKKDADLVIAKEEKKRLLFVRAKHE